MLIAVLVLIVSAVTALIVAYRRQKIVPSVADVNNASPSVIVPAGKEGDFDYRQVDPEIFRPFRKANKVYKWSMSLRRLPPNELFIIDKDYLKLLEARKRCLAEFPEITMGYDDSCVPVIREFYSFVLDYLRKRYPMYFKLQKEGSYVLNELTMLKLPMNPSSVEVSELLRLLGQTITEDFIMLLNNNSQFPEEFCVRGFTGCAPGGVDTSSKLNMPITAIHEPIPEFLDKLRVAMIKFFNRLKPGEFMSRNNWFIAYSDPPRMFYFIGESEATENHPASLDNFQANKRKMNPKLLDFNQVFFRNEKQSFIKLPQTGAAVMIVKTYVTPLTKIRDEELLGPELCEAIDGLQGVQGEYKGVERWGECMKSYLRGDTNGITDEVYDYQFEY